MVVESSQIYFELGEGLRYFIKKSIKNDFDVDDIFQDVFIKIHEKISTLKDRSKINSWVYQITRNTIIDYKRKKEWDSLGEDEADLVALEKESDETLSRGLKLIIESLPAIYRDVLLLKNYSDLCNKDISIRLGISENALKTRIYRANLQFKTRVIEFCNFEFDRYGVVVDYCPTDNFVKYIKKRKKC